MSLNIEDLRLKANSFYKSKLWVFIKRFDSHNRIQYINGPITEKPTEEYFVVKDMEKEEDSAPIMVLFKDLLDENTIFSQSSKQKRIKNV